MKNLLPRKGGVPTEGTNSRLSLRKRAKEEGPASFGSPSSRYILPHRMVHRRSCLPDFDGRSALREQSPANFAHPPITSPSTTKLPSIEDDLQMQLVPAFPREQPLESSFCIYNVFPTRQPPTLSEPVDVSVYRKCRNTKSL